ncbi:hypothetical protein AB0F18_30100 [Streptomyces sp. NPDC029216]|uniref:hypothetical protein n=1 Tax=Streptomyces sp. NPDC029216 TaxID=3154701 RepID=UPI0033EEF32B
MTTHPHPAGAPTDLDAVLAEAPAAAPSSAEGGEPACLLHRVCPSCGRLATGPAAGCCSRCGTELPE